MERMREKVRDWERRMMAGKKRTQRKGSRERDMVEKITFVALNPFHLTIFRLLHSIRVSMDPRSRQFLIFAAYGVNAALQLLQSLEKFRGRIESKWIEALEGEIRDAAWKLENALDSHVSGQFLSRSEKIENEKQALLFSLNLQLIEQDIEGFIEMVFKMEKLLNPWLQQDSDSGGIESDSLGFSEVDVISNLFIRWLPEQNEEESDDNGGKESDMLGLPDKSEVDVSRSWFISWFATKAASVFLGTKEEYIQELENLLPQEEEDDDYAVMFTVDRTMDFSRMVSEDRFRKINDDLMIWWITKAAASMVVIERDYTQRLVKPLPESESGVKMVGSTDLFCRIRDDLLQDFTRLKFGVIVGMAGIGKTALAKKIIQDPLVSSKFECCIFVRLGPEYKLEEILGAIVAQMPDGDKMLMEEDVDLSLCVRKALRIRKCLIVLDDFWNRGPWNIFDIDPVMTSRSVILFTSRIDKRALDFQLAYTARFYQVPFLNKEESWDLLHRKIFGEKRCLPRELEKAGKMIAENCEGLPLLILAVAGLLSQAEKTPEYWSKVAANKTNSIFVDAYEQVSDVVYPSYYYLPQVLKACFLYLGAFPQNVEVRVSRLISLWAADGFLGVPCTFLQNYAYILLSHIVHNNAALGTQWSTASYRHKALSLHSVFWYLCKREARNEKFLHVLNSYLDASVDGIKSQRRLSIYNNTILSIKDVRDSISSIPAVHSLLCTGPYHQYEVPICFGKLRLLKVLDALTIRFYDFPIEVVKLVQLRYLALTCNGNLPPSISNLWDLRCLILHQHQSIKSSVSHSYLPVEIWDLLELEHLQIMGRNLPDPPHGTVLRNLMILLDVGAHTCTKRVLASIPNLQKLRVQIELMPLAAEPPRFCDDISRLRKLESLQFVIVNPDLKYEFVGPGAFVSYSYLRKLTLSGFGYPWKDMHNIAELPNLEVLKLKCYAFQGANWHVKLGQFWSLKYLSIEDTDLVWWTGGEHSFKHLKVLTIKNCYELLELPELPSYLSAIWVVDCNPSAVTCAKQKECDYCNVYVDSSWLRDGKLS